MENKKTIKESIGILTFLLLLGGGSMILSLKFFNSLPLLVVIIIITFLVIILNIKKEFGIFHKIIYLLFASLSLLIGYGAFNKQFNNSKTNNNIESSVESSDEITSNEPTIEQSRMDMNPNWQLIEIIYNKPFNNNGYGLTFYSGSDKYGYESYENKVVFIFSENIVNEIKKYKDFNSLTNSDDVQIIVDKMANFNKENQSNTKKVTFKIE